MAHLHRQRTSGRIRRPSTRLCHQRSQCEIPQFAREHHLQQAQRTLRTLPSQGSHQEARPMLSGGGIHRRDGHAPARSGKCGGIIGDSTHHRTDKAHTSHDQQHHGHLRWRRSRHTRQRERNRHAAGRRDERQAATPARRRRPRQLRP